MKYQSFLDRKNFTIDQATQTLSHKCEDLIQGCILNNQAFNCCLNAGYEQGILQRRIILKNLGNQLQSGEKAALTIKLKLQKADIDPAPNFLFSDLFAIQLADQKFRETTFLLVDTQAKTQVELQKRSSHSMTKQLAKKS